MAALDKLAVAVLGVLAYANREKLGKLLRSDMGGPDSKLGGVGELLDRFRNTGRKEEVDSWINQGPNRPLQRQHIEEAIDADTIEALSQQTGLSREELLDRLTKDLPEGVDKMTPDGRLPDETDRSVSPGGRTF
jgi:uncharacterized protein YidB (DUF937 family)